MEDGLGKVDSGIQFGIAEVKGSTSSGERRAQTVLLEGKVKGEAVREGASRAREQEGGNQKHLPHPSVSPDPLPAPTLLLTGCNVIFAWDQERGEPNGTAL